MTFLNSSIERRPLSNTSNGTSDQTITADYRICRRTKRSLAYDSALYYKDILRKKNILVCFIIHLLKIFYSDFVGKNV